MSSFEDLLPLLLIANTSILLLMIIVFFIHRRNNKKHLRDLEEKIYELPNAAHPQHKQLDTFKQGFLFCAPHQRPKNAQLIISALRSCDLNFGSCGAIFVVCLLEKIRIEADRSVFKLLKKLIDQIRSLRLLE